MKKYLSTLAGIIAVIGTAALAQWNTYQPLQPFNRYALVRSASGLPTPTFAASFESSITPEIGSAGTFTRGTARNYWSSPTTISSVTANNPAIPAYQFDHNSTAGLYLAGPTCNLALRSEAITTTWSAVGSPTLNASIGSTYGVTFGSITGNSGEGITQTIAVAAASKTVMFSMFAVALTNPVTVRMTIEGASGGTPETQNQDIIVTHLNLTKPARYNPPVKVFTGSATGNIKVTLTLRETGTVFVGGLMVEDKETNGNTDLHTRIPGMYIATAGSSVCHEADILTYPAASISNVETFTFSVWINTDFRGFANSTPYRDGSPSADDKYVFRVRDASNNVVMEFLPGWSNNANARFNGGSVVQTLYERHYEHRWYHYVVTADYANDIYKIYRNGDLKITDTEVRTTPGAANDFYIGFPTPYRAPNAIIRNVKYYDEVLSDTEVAALFTSEVGDFQEATYGHDWPLNARWHDPFTIAFWDFSEASGTITDEVNEIPLSVSGSPTFAVTYSGQFADLSPGIRYASGAAHRKLTATTQFDHDLSASNHMLEVWIEKESTTGEQNIFTSLGHGSNTDYGWRLYFLDDDTVRFDLQADDGSTKNCSWDIASLVDGDPHKLRVHWGQNTLGKLWVDEVRHATECDDDAGTTYTNEGIRIGEKYDGSGSNFIGVVLSWKYTFATGDAAVTMTNSGGPLSLGSE